MADLPATKPVPTTHPTAFWFFFWGEFAERCSYYGMRVILAKYMADVLDMGQSRAGVYMSIFIAACYLLPLLGGFIADNFLGKYWTIVGFSVPYVAGQFFVGFPDKTVFILSLCLLAMGSGVIKPNISTLMGLTYDQQRPGQERLRSEAFSWFYLAINIGAALSQTIVPIVKDHYGYREAFLVPAVLMTVALVFFALGKGFYAKETIGGDRNAPSITVADRLAVVLRVGVLFLPVMFFWAVFDQSASTWIFFADTWMNCQIFGYEVSAEAIQSANAYFIIAILPLTVILWRKLAKKGIVIKPTQKMILGFVLTAVTMAIMGFAGYLAGPPEKAIKVTPRFGEFQFTPGEYKPEEQALLVKKGRLFFVDSRILVRDEVAGKDGKTYKTSATIAGASGEIVFVGDSDSLKDDRFSFKDAVVLLKKGSVVHEDTMVAVDGGSIGSDVIKGSVENNAEEKTTTLNKVKLTEVTYVKPENRVSVWWQVFAYLILTIAEILISVTGLELAFVAAPAQMKGFITAMWLLTVFLANALVNAPLTAIYPSFHPANYFFMLTGIMVGVMFAFIFAKNWFNAKMIQEGKQPV